MEQRFLDASAKLFWAAPHLGSPAAQPSGTTCNNYLTAAICKYFAECQRPQAVLDFFEPLARTDPELSSILARFLLLARTPPARACDPRSPVDREPEAIRHAHQAISKRPTLAPLLLWQCEFLAEKGCAAEAVQVAKLAVKAAPIDYLSWAWLARAHILARDYPAALIALNNCPVTLPPLPEPMRLGPVLRAWIPRRDDAIADHVSAVPAKESVLERLRAPALRGALKEIYSVLVALLQAVGWDDLLALRSRVFMMEEEYRAQINPDAAAAHMDERAAAGRAASEMQQVSLDDSPRRSATEPAASSPQDAPAEAGSKRLCERWLDNLFMILFEDMRVYTIYQGELEHFKSENMSYQRTGREWLILGDLCRRLGFPSPAKEAYRHCVELAFCRTAWLALLHIYTTEDRVAHALTAAAKILAFDQNYHNSAMVPSAVPPPSTSPSPCSFPVR